MPKETRWVVRVLVWSATGLGALVMALYRGELSVGAMAQNAFWISGALGMLGLLYVLGGAAGDAFPPATVVDLNARQNLRGQPLDHGRSALRRPTFGGVVMVASAGAAVVSLMVWLVVGV